MVRTMLLLWVPTDTGGAQPAAPGQLQLLGPIRSAQAYCSMVAGSPIPGIRSRTSERENRKVHHNLFNCDQSLVS